MIDGLTQVVQEAAAAGHLHVGAKLVGDHGGQVGRLHGVFELVLAVAVAVLEASQSADNLRVEAGAAGLDGGLFACLLDGGLDLFAGLLHHLLDTGRVDAAVC